MTRDVKESPQIAALEAFVGVLSRADEDGQDVFYSRLAEAVCELGSMRRAAIFRYDDILRRVRAVGGYNVDLVVLDAPSITVPTSPLAQRALDEDRVLEIHGDFDRELPQAAGILAGGTVVCTPMLAAGRRVGVIFSDRGDDAPPLTADQRELLWSLGKMAALAAVARIATSQHERSRHLRSRLSLAREVHESVIQRLFGISLALSVDQDLDAADARRAGDEVQEAIVDLRTALQRPLTSSRQRTRWRLREELRRLARDHEELVADVEEGALELPEDVEDVVGEVLSETVRNAYKHAVPERVEVRLREDGPTVVLEVANDGVGGRDGPRSPSGMGLRLAAFEVVQLGGVLEFGPRGDAAWHVRLVIPLEAAVDARDRR